MKNIRILVPISHTEHLDPAFERALTLARPLDAELYLVHAVPGDRTFSAKAAERLERWAELRERAASAGVRVETVEQQGDAASVIVLHAESRKVDLIVMSTERRTGWDGIRQPSVAERVIRRTTRPTLVVRQDGAVPAAFSNVLVAVDISPASKTVIDIARRLFGHDDVSMQLHVAPGPIGKAIVEQAAAVDADLIVVGRNKRFMRSRSTPIRLLRDTDHALLIVPPAASGSAIHSEPSTLRRAA